MNREIAQKIRTYLQGKQEEQAGFIARLAELESPTTEPLTLGPVFQMLSDALTPLGFECRVLQGKASGGQFFARPYRREKGSTLQMLLGHGDTVWPVGTLRSMPLRRDGPILAGPGVYDMKAGLAQAVFALDALSKFGLEPEAVPVFFVTSDEELGSDDSRARIERLARRMNRVLVLEPSGPEGALKTARKGTGVFQVEVEGKSAHAGVEPEAGISAILEIAGIIRELHLLNDPVAGTSVSVGTVTGGTRVNVVPAQASASVDVRVRTVAEGERIQRAILSLQPRLPGAKLRISGLMDRPPLERSERNRALWRQARTAGQLLELDLEEIETGGGSDGNLTSPFAATLDGLGAVGGGAHAEHEFIRVDRLAERTALLALLLMAPPL